MKDADLRERVSREKRTSRAVWIHTQERYETAALLSEEPLAAEIRRKAAGISEEAFGTPRLPAWFSGRAPWLSRLWRRIHPPPFLRVEIPARRAVTVWAGEHPLLRLEWTPRGPRAAIVLDDAGHRPDELEPYLALRFPFTVAVLPQSRHAAEVARRAESAGVPLIIHQPMEPHGLRVRGAGILRPEYEEEKIRQILAGSLARLPEARGLSNHQGSRFTESEKAMRACLLFLKEKGLFYFDSHTSTASVGYPLAREMGLPALVNDNFLDNVDEEEAIRRRLQLLRKQAKKWGRATAIGHVRRRHLATALAKELPEFEKEGVALVTLPELLDARSGD